MSRLAKILWLAFAIVSGPAFAQSEIRWQPDLATARRSAAQFQVPMLIHFYGDNCLPCKTLEQRVLNQDAVIKTLNKYFICVRVNASQDRATAAEYQVHSWPTDVFVSADGQVLYQGVCKQDIPGYMEVLQNVAISNRDRNTQIAASRAGQPLGQSQGQFAGSAMPAQSTPAQMNAAPGNPNMANATMAPSSAITASTPATQFQVAPPTRPGMMDNGGLPPLPGHLASRPLGNNVTGQMNTQANLPSVAAGANTQKPVANNPNSSLVSNPYFPESEPMVCTPDGKCGPASSMAQHAGQTYNGTPTSNQHLAGSDVQNRSMQQTSGAALNGGPQFPPLSATATTAGTLAEPTFQPKSAMLVANSKILSDDAPAETTGDTKLGLIEAAPPEMEPAAFNGYCPISLVKTGLKVQGKTEHAVRHRGRTYLMENPEAVREFMQAPDRFSPVLSGYDPMVFLESGKLVDGTLENALYDPNSGMIILFSSASSQNKFKADPVRNTKALGYILNAATKK
ncbi:MAG: thioredoxin family protein [Pirellulaceae bacterium]|nr:thioredoxin family protein [Pirellulaceae bacterium]